jgi:hypothetical protein
VGARDQIRCPLGSYMLTKVAMFLVAGRKMKFNHWLKEAPFDLRARFPEITGIDEVQTFFRRHFTDEVDAFPSKTAAEYAGELRDLVALLRGHRVPRLVWSFLTPGHQVPISGVSAIPILLGMRTRRLVARVDVSGPAQVSIEFVSEDNATILAESKLTSSTSGLTKALVMEDKSGFPPGWYRLSLSVYGVPGSSSNASLRSVAVYAD